MPLTLTARECHGQHDFMTSTTVPVRSRSLNAWLKADDRRLAEGLQGGLALSDIAADLDRDAVLVLRRLDTLGIFEFARGSEEWVEIMSMALSDIPLQDVVAWCTAAEERMPYELLDAMRSGPDLRNGFELARQLGIDVHNEQAVVDLHWLVTAMSDATAGAAIADATARLEADHHGVTASAVRAELLGLTPVADPHRRPAAKGKAGTRGRKTSHPRTASTARATGTRPRKTRIRNRWAYANYMKGKAAAARA